MGSKTLEKIAYEKLQNPTVALAKIAIKHGLSPSYANTGQIAQKKTYKDIMAKDSEATLKRMAILREQALKIAKKKAVTAKYSELINSAATMTDKISDLTGNSKEKTAIVINFVNFSPNSQVKE